MGWDSEEEKMTRTFRHQKTRVPIHVTFAAISVTGARLTHTYITHTNTRACTYALLLLYARATATVSRSNLFWQHCEARKSTDGITSNFLAKGFTEKNVRCSYIMPRGEAYLKNIYVTKASLI